MNVACGHRKARYVPSPSRCSATPSSSAVRVQCDTLRALRVLRSPARTSGGGVRTRCGTAGADGAATAAAGDGARTARRADGSVRPAEGRLARRVKGWAARSAHDCAIAQAFVRVVVNCDKDFVPTARGRDPQVRSAPKILGGERLGLADVGISGARRRGSRRVRTGRAGCCCTATTRSRKCQWRFTGSI